MNLCPSAPRMPPILFHPSGNSEGGTFMNEISAVIKEAPRELPPHTHVRTREDSSLGTRTGSSRCGLCRPQGQRQWSGCSWQGLTSSMQSAGRSRLHTPVRTGAGGGRGRSRMLPAEGAATTQRWLLHQGKLTCHSGRSSSGFSVKEAGDLDFYKYSPYGLKYWHHFVFKP